VREERFLNTRINWMSMMAISRMEYTINKGGKGSIIHGSAANANDAIVGRQVPTGGKVIKGGDEFNLGKVTGNTDNDESKAVHRGSLAWVIE